MPFSEHCIEVLTHSHIKCEEKYKTFILKNKAKQPVRKVTIDGCLIKNLAGQKACDFGLWADGSHQVFLVELKGKNMSKACEQILETIKFLKDKYLYEIEGKKLIACIVAGKNDTPKLQQDPRYIKLRKICNLQPLIGEKRMEYELS